MGMEHIDKNAAVADFSSSQRFSRKVDPLVPDIVAPGVDVVSAMPGGGYQMKDGSSMATPHVTGTIALIDECITNGLAPDPRMTVVVTIPSSVSKGPRLISTGNSLPSLRRA